MNSLVHRYGVWATGALLVALVVGLALFYWPLSTQGKVQLEKKPEAVWDVSVVKSPYARGKGLQGIKRLSAQEGMLFVYASPSTRGFWMKDTYLALDIAFLDHSGVVLDTSTMQPCREEVNDDQTRCPLYRPGMPYTYVFELPAGVLKAHQVEVGDRFLLSET